jgi:hypothetical protein
MLADRSWDQWVAQYGGSHQHPVNRFCHTLGIPLIALSLPLFLGALFITSFWPVPTILFVLGWGLQFAGHAFEGKSPPCLVQGFGRIPSVEIEKRLEEVRDAKAICAGGGVRDTTRRDRAVGAGTAAARSMAGSRADAVCGP